MLSTTSSTTRSLSSPSTGQLAAQKQTTTLSHMCHLDIDSNPIEYRKTSIICTIGPKTNSVEALRDLFHAGMSIVRMNFSHGSYEYHQSVVDNARAAEASIPGAVIAIALDTKGPEIRTGVLKNDQEITLERGSQLVITTDKSCENDCDASTLYVDYVNLPKVVAPGKLIYVDDGLISLRVLEIQAEDRVLVEVVNSGRLGSRKGVNLPDIKVDLPAVSEKDTSDLLFGLRNNVDMIFASFIRKASDVHDVRHVLGEQGRDIKIISKIENHEGVRNFDEILAVSDGIMVARGDLGIEIPPEKVFVAQKMMIAKCNIAGKPVICATQMLESMTFNPRPTRAEVSDVANAVLDGADCVMLSGETAKGAYPIEAVTMMAKTCLEAESAVHYKPLFAQLRLHTPTPVSMSECVASSAVNASIESHAAAIIVLTLSGNSARLLAKYRPECPIIAVTRFGHTARCIHLYRGCHPLIGSPKVDGIDWQGDVQARLNEAIAYGRRKNLLQAGDTIVCVQGWKGGSGHTNTMRLIVIE